MGLPMLWVMAAATSSLCATNQSMAAPILALRSAKPDANQAACACLAAFTACSMSLDLAYSRRHNSCPSIGDTTLKNSLMTALVSCCIK